MVEQHVSDHIGRIGEDEVRDIYEGSPGHTVVIFDDQSQSWSCSCGVGSTASGETWRGVDQDEHVSDGE